MVEVLNVTPETLRQAADGINGVIEGLSGGFMGSYQGQLGRGFNDLALSGEEMSHPDAHAGFSNYTQRCEWGTRALVVRANDIGNALDIGAGMYELQEDYFNNAAKDMVNDLVGDPSLHKESIRDEHGNIIERGTDDMSWGEMVDSNVNRLTNPDWSTESFTEALPTIRDNWQSIQDNAGQAVANAVVPGEMVQTTVEGFTGQRDTAQPGSAPAADPAL